MTLHIYLPDGLLQMIGEVKLLDKALITSDAKLTPLGGCTYWALVSLVLFTLVYKLSRYTTPLFFKGYEQMTIHDQRDWDTRPGNILFSAYVAYGSIHAVMMEDPFWSPGPQPMMKRTSSDSYAVLGISIGFFLMEMAVTIKYWMGGTAMIIHHLGSLASVLCAAFFGEGHCATLWMLSTEFTTPFIAFRYLLEKGGLKSHPIYVINGIAILVSWTVARLATFVPFFIVMWHHRDQIPLMNPVVQLLLLVFAPTLAVLNTYWYTKIVRGAVKVLSPQKRTKRGAKSD
ncbi:hypothetical protein VaNZ11_016248 [Volvox africanus]|uniref:TLC domain-containing protein n=1 Tax=Volvox africanus TaxID=51714 RepID=A0ABQ5SMC5_9CHLO|nr:hypothetical protein VaNZ11_016248 [Volvox africanus]